MRLAHPQRSWLQTVYAPYALSSLDTDDPSGSLVPSGHANAHTHPKRNTHTNAKAKTALAKTALFGRLPQPPGLSPTAALRHYVRLLVRGPHADGLGPRGLCTHASAQVPVAALRHTRTSPPACLQPHSGLAPRLCEHTGPAGRGADGGGPVRRAAARRAAAAGRVPRADGAAPGRARAAAQRDDAQPAPQRRHHLPRQARLAAAARDRLRAA